MAYWYKQVRYRPLVVRVLKFQKSKIRNFRKFWLFFYASGSNILSISSSIVSSEYFMYLLTLDTFKIISNDSTLDDESLIELTISHTNNGTS